MNRLRCLALFAVTLLTVLSSVHAQDDDDFGAWFSAGVERKIAKGLDAGIETEYRMSDNVSEMDRWTLGASMSYRLFRNREKTFDIKAELGAKFLRLYNPERTVMKDSVFIWDEETESDVFIGREFNLHDDYFVNKFRTAASLSASYEVGRFKFSLRERYQFTCNDSVSALKHQWRYDYSTSGIIEKDQEENWHNTGNRCHVLRSRLQASYNIRGFKLDPYASVEITNDLKDGLSLVKTRYLCGLDYRIKKDKKSDKSHNIKMYYLYQVESDDDEPQGHAVGLSYCYSF